MKGMRSVIKSEKISIKWKIFCYLLGFTVILLVILWMLQIAYLDAFYKLIKTEEAESVSEQVIELVSSGEDIDTLSDEIDEIAAANNLSVLVTDAEGNTLYNAEYIANSSIAEIPQQIFQQYYELAEENDGSAKIEFKGNENKTFTEKGMVPPDDAGPAANDNRTPTTDDAEFSAEEAPSTEEEGGFDGDWKNGYFMQNHGQEMAESVIYFNIVNAGSEEYVVMVNSVLTPVDATVNTLKVQLIWISALMVLLSLGIALLLSKQVSKSMIKVTKSANELAAGNYGVEFDGKDYREITELSNTLNYMTKELEKTENLRRELIANVSHDLRTPLTMVIAYSEVMRDLPGENTPENIQVVIDESKRLTNLVNDMLDISKLQAGVLEKNATVFNLTNSIQSVFERYNKLKEQDGYTINFEYGKEVFVCADEFKIYQVIYNLVNNAINYTGADKTVTVRQITKGNRVRIEISDSGEGIAEEELPYVWDRYYKVDKTHKRAIAGTGLGLSIVKNILQLHDAQYGVESEVGKGSTFWFVLELEQ